MSEFGFMDDVEVKDTAPDFGDDRDGLSPMLRELEQLIGLDATLMLVDGWGGIVLYVPQTIPTGHDIERAIGEEAAAKLVGYCGGDHISMPKAEVFHRMKRDHEIYQQKMQKVPAWALARKHNLTIRHVWQIIQNERDRIAERKYKKTMGTA